MPRTDFIFISLPVLPTLLIATIWPTSRDKLVIALENESRLQSGHGATDSDYDRRLMDAESFNMRPSMSPGDRVYVVKGSVLEV
jgi:hypothetical protein